MARLPAVVLAVVLVASACGGSSSSDGGGGDDDPLAAGREVYGRTCVVCHGDRGQGGVGPALANVTATFPDCADQVAWVSLGSEGWREQRGPTYGATAKQVQGGMPGMADSLPEADIAAVAAWERSRFGGADPATAAADCQTG